MLDAKMDVIWKELEEKAAPRSDSVLLHLMQEHGYQMYANHVKLDEDGRRYIEKGKIKIRIGNSMLKRWRARITGNRASPIVNRAVTSKSNHDMSPEEFIPIWRSWLIQYRADCRAMKPTVGPMGGYKLA